MFIGHYSVALAAKRAAPQTSLGTLFLAAQFLDLLWPIFLLLGVERVRIDPGNTVFTPLDFVHYPITHSLQMAVGWAILFAFLYLITKGYLRGAITICVAVISHWLLDAATHRPDLPLYPGSHTLVGFGLWNSLTGTVIVEGLLLVIGVALYLKTTRARDKIGVYSFWSFIVVIVLIYVGNIFGPPPPSVQALAITALLQWLFVPWCYWIDRHREARHQ
jgi:membrane-bound metal-dependent hydrolase YbcI (DUF457 family)